MSTHISIRHWLYNTTYATREEIISDLYSAAAISDYNLLQCILCYCNTAEFILSCIANKDAYVSLLAFEYGNSDLQYNADKIMPRAALKYNGMHLVKLALAHGATSVSASLRCAVISKHYYMIPICIQYGAVNHDDLSCDATKWLLNKYNGNIYIRNDFVGALRFINNSYQKIVSEYIYALRLSYYDDHITDIICQYIPY